MKNNVLLMYQCQRCGDRFEMPRSIDLNYGQNLPVFLYEDIYYRVGYHKCVSCSEIYDTDFGIGFLVGVKPNYE